MNQFAEVSGKQFMKENKKERKYEREGFTINICLLVEDFGKHSWGDFGPFQETNMFYILAYNGKHQTLSRQCHRLTSWSWFLRPMLMERLALDRTAVIA